MSLAEAPCHDVGYWSRDAVVAMDNRAVARMATVHPYLVTDELRATIRRFNAPIPPKFDAAEADRILAAFLHVVPEIIADMASTGRSIMREVADKHGLTTRELAGDSHRLNIVNARYEAMYRMCKELGLTHSEAGRIIRKDHATVRRGVLICEKRVAELGEDAAFCLD